MSFNYESGCWQEALIGNKDIKKKLMFFFLNCSVPKLLLPAWIKRVCDCLSNKTTLELSTFLTEWRSCLAAKGGHFSQRPCWKRKDSSEGEVKSHEVQ